MERRIFAEEHRAFRDVVRRYVSEEIVPRYDTWQREAHVPREEWTRAARHGLLYTSEGTLTIKQARYREDAEPPDPACACPTCRSCSRAYLRHLFVSGEPTAATLLTVHNLTSILDLMRRIRDALETNTFGALAAGTAERSRTDDRKDAR